MADLLDMLTAREVQDLLQVDRSTIYRMAEDGRLPAVKVGKQWRFSPEEIKKRFQIEITEPAAQNGRSKDLVLHDGGHRDLANLSSWNWLEIVQETYADLLGVMIIVTDINGKPIGQPANACGLFTSINQQPGVMQSFVRDWHSQATTLDLTPSFRVNNLGLYSARSVIAIGTELAGMVIAGCIAPPEWPPSPTKISEIANYYNVSPKLFAQHTDEIYFLDTAQQNLVLTTLPRISALIAHIVDERLVLVDRLRAIANMAHQSPT